MDPHQQIIKFLGTIQASYVELEHAPIFTLDQAASVPELLEREGVKTLLLKAKAKFIVAVLPGSQKLDSKKLKQHLGIKEIRFATPAEVKEVMGCIVGSCYPFGSIVGLSTYVDCSLLGAQKISFNPGQHDKSIRIEIKDYLALEKPKLVDIALPKQG